MMRAHFVLTAEGSGSPRQRQVRALVGRSHHARDLRTDTQTLFKGCDGTFSSCVNGRNKPKEGRPMSTWLYQISPKLWNPQRYRLEIWESERWSWPVGAMSGAGQKPEPGDILVTFYSQSGGNDPGFYGWAIILEWIGESGNQLRFRPVSPSDRLKMHPWWSKEATSLSDRIRGEMKQRTLWVVPNDLVPELRRGIVNWLAGRETVDSKKSL